MKSILLFLLLLNAYVLHGQQDTVNVIGIFPSLSCSYTPMLPNVAGQTLSSEEICPNWAKCKEEFRICANEAVEVAKKKLEEILAQSISLTLMITGAGAYLGAIFGVPHIGFFIGFTVGAVAGILSGFRGISLITWGFRESYCKGCQLEANRCCNL